MLKLSTEHALAPSDIEDFFNERRECAVELRFCRRRHLMST